MPKRSASRITITVAFGTSTPTSITVVATSTSSSPARNAAIVASLSRRRHPPVQQPEPQPAQLAGLQPLVRLLGRADLELLATPRSAGTRRTPGGRPRPRRAPAPTPRPRSSGLGPAHHLASCDRRAARRQLVEHRHVEVAVDGHRRGARDRRRRHHQHVGHGLAARPSPRSAARCSTPKRCCSSITDDAERRNSTPS